MFFSTTFLSLHNRIYRKFLRVKVYSKIEEYSIDIENLYYVVVLEESKGNNLCNKRSR